MFTLTNGMPTTFVAIPTLSIVAITPWEGKKDPAAEPSLPEKREEQVPLPGKKNQW
jgi:hypothetical protein